MAHNINNMDDDDGLDDVEGVEEALEDPEWLAADPAPEWLSPLQRNSWIILRNPDRESFIEITPTGIFIKDLGGDEKSLAGFLNLIEGAHPSLPDQRAHEYEAEMRAHEAEDKASSATACELA